VSHAKIKRCLVNKLTIELPESLHRAIRGLADQEGYTVEQFLATAAAEKVAALRTVDYLRREAAGARREDFERYLAAVPARPPNETDAMPEKEQERGTVIQPAPLL